MVELVCFTLPYRLETFERALQGIRQAGYDSVGFGLPHKDGGYPAEPTLAEAERIGRLLEKYSLRPRILYGARTQAGTVEELCAWVDFSVALGKPAMVWVGVSGYRRFPSEPLPAAEYQAAHQAFVAKMREVGAYAQEKGVTITLKPHTGNTATGPILAATLREIGSPAVRACLDPGNVAYYEGISPEEDIAAVIDQVELLTMKDHRGPRAHPDFPVPGEGDVDFVRILRDLKAAGFNGALLVERVDGTDGSNLSAEEIDRRIAAARENVLKMAREAGYAV